MSSMNRGGYRERIGELCFWAVKAFRARPLLWLGIAFLLVLTVLSPFLWRTLSPRNVVEVAYFRRLAGDRSYVDFSGSAIPGAIFPSPFEGDNPPFLLYTNWLALIGPDGVVRREYRRGSSSLILAPGRAFLDDGKGKKVLVFGPDGALSGEIPYGDVIATLAGMELSRNGRFLLMWGKTSPELMRREGGMGGSWETFLLYDVLEGKVVGRESIPSQDSPVALAMGDEGEVALAFPLREEPDPERGVAKRKYGGWVRVGTLTPRGFSPRFEKETRAAVERLALGGGILLVLQSAEVRRGRDVGERKELWLHDLASGEERLLLSSFATEEQSRLLGDAVEKGVDPTPYRGIAVKGMALIPDDGEGRLALVSFSPAGEVVPRTVAFSVGGKGVERKWGVPGEIPRSPRFFGPGWLALLRSGFLVVVDSGTGDAVGFSERKGYGDAFAWGPWLVGVDGKAGAIDLYSLRSLLVKKMKAKG